MKKRGLTIDGRDITVAKGKTVLEAAAALDIAIPILCHRDGIEPFTSCMVCVVLETRTGKMIPACTAPAAEGMRIETDTPAVRQMRRDSLDFLLSEHVGECEAPCSRACPAGMNIPQMIREIRSERFDLAVQTVKRHIALPAVLGRICPAPCEKACRRKDHDQPVSICLLKRLSADLDQQEDSPWRAEGDPTSGKIVAIIGAGPAGLAAAYYLSLKGHLCTIYDKNSLPGGNLRTAVPNDILPKSVLDADIRGIIGHGVTFEPERELGRNLDLEDLCRSVDAVLLTPGAVSPSLFDGSGLKMSPKGIKITRPGYTTSRPGVFAAGGVVTESKMAVRAVGQGREAARSIHRFLEGHNPDDNQDVFHSLFGQLKPEEVGEYLKEAEENGRVKPQGFKERGFTREEAVREAGRCFGCDCRKLSDCRLRRFASEYGADQKRYRAGERRPIEKNLQHADVVYEPGKCIKCGLCVRITKNSGEELGLTFVGRGFDVRVEAPFGESLNKALVKAAAECVEACPTAALSWKERKEKRP
ncbi:MAG: 2Fe-2S iron-sulfur cluster-binding protein [Candidatus Aminicenantes bacterium]|nr:2Fe-2S iron-sulfur cluster-binding protein [Candidatus Aminicenantes bacterium]